MDQSLDLEKYEGVHDALTNFKKMYVEIVSGNVHQAKNGKMSKKEDGTIETHELIRRILSQGSMETLKRSLYQTPGAGSPRCSVAISTYNTIEFRSPESSFEIEFIALWAKIVRRILEIALWEESEYSEMLCKLFRMAHEKSDVDWNKWLDAIGLQAYEDYCKSRVKAYAEELKHIDHPAILPKIQ